MVLMQRSELYVHLQAARAVAVQEQWPLIIYLIDVTLSAVQSGRRGGRFGEILGAAPDGGESWRNEGTSGVSEGSD